MNWRGSLFGLAWLASAVASAAAPQAAETKFAIPIWHPDARWEVEDPYAGSSAPGFLEGPRLESQPFAGKVGPLYGPTQAGRHLILSFDPRSEFVFVAAGSARGFLDGPFSRARFGANNYNYRPTWAHAPDGRFSYMTDVANGHALRRLDRQLQEVKTIRRDVTGFGGMTIDDRGTLLFIQGEDLLRLDSEGNEKARLRLGLEESVRGIGGCGASLALDDVNGRLYATAISPKQWYVWYWDLKDGSFHGVLPMPAEGQGRKRDEPGPFDGTRLYGEGTVFFGPDDPEHRFLYTARTDTWGLFRLDLPQRHMSSLTTVAEKGKPPVAYFIDQGTPTRVSVYGRAAFMPDGSILSSRHTPFVATRCRRIQ